MPAPHPDIFIRFMSSLQLKEIRPVSLHADCLEDPATAKGEALQIRVDYAFADDDPFPLPDGIRLFRPKFVALIQKGKTDVFRQESIFFVAVAVTDEPVFAELWADATVREHFMKLQLRKTLWPLFRQHVHDGMSRVGLPAVTLPWVTG